MKGQGSTWHVMGIIPVKSATFLAVMVARRVSFSCWVTTTGVLARGGGGDNLLNGLGTKEGQVPLSGELWWGGQREI